MTIQEVNQRIKILGYSSIGVPFTFDGHTLALVLSTGRYRKRYGYKPGGFDISSYKDLLYLTYAHLRYDTWTGNEWYMGSGLKLLRDISELNFCFVSEAIISAYKNTGDNRYTDFGEVGAWLTDGYCEEDDGYITHAYYVYDEVNIGESNSVAELKYNVACIDLNNPYIFRNRRIQIGNSSVPQILHWQGNLVIS